MGVRAELFRTIYFHRTVRAIDLTLADLFRESSERLFPGNPLEHLAAYRDFTESSLLVDVARWPSSPDPALRDLGQRWRDLLQRRFVWKLACQRTLVFSEADRERSSIFSDRRLVEQQLRAHLPSDLRDLPMRIDIARLIHRPHTRGPADGQNFLFDSARGDRATAERQRTVPTHAGQSSDLSHLMRRAENMPGPSPPPSTSSSAAARKMTSRTCDSQDGHPCRRSKLESVTRKE